MIPPGSRSLARPPKAKAAPGVWLTKSPFPAAGSPSCFLSLGSGPGPGSRGFRGPGPGTRRRAQPLCLRGRTLSDQSASPGVAVPDFSPRAHYPEPSVTWSHRRAVARASRRGRLQHAPPRPTRERGAKCLAAPCLPETLLVKPHASQLEYVSAS